MKNSTDIYNYNITISVAQSRARGDRLRDLCDICQNQKHISTKKLRKFVDELLKSDTQDSVHFTALANKIRKLQVQINETKSNEHIAKR
jgi:hypothetical protein